MTVRASITNRFRAALAEALQRAGVTSELAFTDVLRERGIKLRQQDLSAWRRGRIPNLDRLPDIARALEVPWEWLLVGADGAKRVEQWGRAQAGIEAGPRPPTPRPILRGARGQRARRAANQ